MFPVGIISGRAMVKLASRKPFARTEIEPLKSPAIQTEPGALVDNRFRIKIRLVLSQLHDSISYKPTEKGNVSPYPECIWNAV